MKTPKKRKLQKKTNYSTRMKLLRSDMPRIAVRKSNKYLVVQYIISEESKDKVLLSVSSRDLLEKGFSDKMKGSLKSIPAGYLTGYLAGKEILKEGFEDEAILDIGLQRGIPGNRLFGVLKGLVDAGVNIHHSEKAFPSQDRLEGKHLKEDVRKEIHKVKQALMK